MIHNETKKYTWSVAPYEHYERSVDWYWAMGIVIAAMVIISLVTRNYLFAFLMVMGGVLMVMSLRNAPSDMNIEISERAIAINGHQYRYDQIKSFWMYNDLKNKPNLLLHTNKSIFPKIVIPLMPDMDFVELHTFLIDKIHEEEQYESTIDRIADRLGL
jgi:hypothetical protein